jgi:hypothetical protein
MDITAQDAAELAKALAWPATALVGLVVLRHPIADFLRDISKRITKLSVFKVEIELARLVKQRPNLVANIQRLSTTALPDPQVDATVSATNISEIAAGIARAASTDYLVVEVGGTDEKEWQTSRLFLLAALLERSRGFRCIVFTEQGTFIGAASARDVRMALGTRFPRYEQALFAACGEAANLNVGEFRAEPLSEQIIEKITLPFLGPLRQPIGQPHSIQVGSNWELGEWVTSGMLITLLRSSLDRGTVIAGSLTIAKDELLRTIIRHDGTFVALVNQAGEFQELCDRGVIIETLARDVAVQTTAPE